MPLVGLTGGLQLPSAEAKGSRRGHGVVPAFVTSLAPCKQLPCKSPSFLIMHNPYNLTWQTGLLFWLLSKRPDVDGINLMPTRQYLENCAARTVCR